MNAKETFRQELLERRRGTHSEPGFPSTMRVTPRPIREPVSRGTALADKIENAIAKTVAYLLIGIFLGLAIGVPLVSLVGLLGLPVAVFGFLAIWGFADFFRKLDLALDKIVR